MAKSYEPEAPCVCGHVFDEHVPGHECAVEWCVCALFEPNDPEEPVRG